MYRPNQNELWQTPVALFFPPLHGTPMHSQQQRSSPRGVLFSWQGSPGAKQVRPGKFFGKQASGFAVFFLVFSRRPRRGVIAVLSDLVLSRRRRLGVTAGTTPRSSSVVAAVVAEAEELVIVIRPATNVSVIKYNAVIFMVEGSKQKREGRNEGTTLEGRNDFGRKQRLSILYVL